MIEIKFLGKGGQGVVVASELLARACFEKDLYAQSFSIYGGERRGSLVAAFVRVDTKKIYLKCDIERADHLVCFDASLLNDSLASQMKPRGTILVNTPRNVVLPGLRTGLIDALSISKGKGLGPIVNTTILGAYVRLTNICTLDSLISVIRQYVPAQVDANVAACQAAYERMGST
jgi:pyruvate ferredoxin oxidoreductase gamma subunit